eukprot:6484085-Amphidinium_carterae.5
MSANNHESMTSTVGSLLGVPTTTRLTIGMINFDNTEQQTPEAEARARALRLTVTTRTNTTQGNWNT